MRHKHERVSDSLTFIERGGIVHPAFFSPSRPVDQEQELTGESGLCDSVL